MKRFYENFDILFLVRLLDITESNNGFALIVGFILFYIVYLALNVLNCG